MQIQFYEIQRLAYFCIGILQSHQYEALFPANFAYVKLSISTEKAAYDRSDLSFQGLPFLPALTLVPYFSVYQLMSDIPVPFSHSAKSHKSPQKPVFDLSCAVWHIGRSCPLRFHNNYSGKHFLQD